MTLTAALHVVIALTVGAHRLLQVSFHVRILKLLLLSFTASCQFLEELLIIFAAGLVTNI